MRNRDGHHTTIEPATHDDIVAAAHVYQAAAEALSDTLRARNPWASASARAEDLRHAIRALATLQETNRDAVLVARFGADVVGVAAVQVQPPHAHIAFLFVQPDHQGQGIGRHLLNHLQQVIGDSGATVITLASSRDPKAWQSYLRLGLHPGPPTLPFRARVPRFPDLPALPGDVMARPLDPGDVSLIAGIDRDARGVDRREALASWLATADAATALLDRASGDPVGYAIVAMHESHGQIGPVAARAATDVPLVLTHALALAGTVPNPQQRPWRVDVPGRNHVAIAPLLEAGFVAENLITWFETGPVGAWDRYIFRDEDTL